jgi:hypothetical protein
MNGFISASPGVQRSSGHAEELIRMSSKEEKLPPSLIIEDVELLQLVKNVVPADLGLSA